MHVPLAQVGSSLKERLEDPQECEPRDSLEDWPDPWYAVDAIEKGLCRDVDGHRGGGSFARTASTSLNLFKQLEVDVQGISALRGDK